jgi:hypothetical protein
MLAYKTAILKLAKMKASSEMNGGFGFIGTEISMVAMIYKKNKEVVYRDIMAIFSEVVAKMTHRA